MLDRFAPRPETPVDRAIREASGCAELSLPSISTIRSRDDLDEIRRPFALDDDLASTTEFG
jgi:hypothetical protein